MRIIPAEAGDKSASVFIILIFLWCFCWFNLWTFGKTLPEFVFLTQDRIETHCVLLFFWEGGFISELCEENEHHESLWKQKWQMESEGIYFFFKNPVLTISVRLKRLLSLQTALTEIQSASHILSSLTFCRVSTGTQFHMQDVFLHSPSKYTSTVSDPEMIQCCIYKWL